MMIVTERCFLGYQLISQGCWYLARLLVVAAAGSSCARVTRSVLN